MLSILNGSITGGSKMGRRKKTDSISNNNVNDTSKENINENNTTMTIDNKKTINKTAINKNTNKTSANKKTVHKKTANKTTISKSSTSKTASSDGAVRKRGRPKKTITVIHGNSTNVSGETVKAIVKQKHKRPKRSENYQVHTAPGEMSKMITNAMGLRKMGMKGINLNDPNAIDQRIDEFIEYCIEHEMKPTVESMALAFDTNRIQLWRWKEGAEGAVRLPEASKKALKRGYTLMNELLSQYMADGKINPVSAIFLLKNNHAYKDQTDVVVSPSNPYTDQNADDVRDKYINGIPNEIEADGTVE